MSLSKPVKKAKIALLSEYLSSDDTDSSSSSSSEDVVVVTPPKPQPLQLRPKSAAVQFTVHLSTSLANTTPYRGVIFDVVDTNDGNAYSPTTGRFVTPEKGIYAFFISTTFTTKACITLCIIHNFHPVDPDKVQETSTVKYEFDTKTIGAVLTLDQNDEVWVLNVTRITALRGLEESDYASFSGCLVEKL